MNSGVIIVAINNDLVDYVKMAVWSAQRIQHFLKLPTSLITNIDVNHDCFDRIIKITPDNNNQKYYQDYGKTTEWYNQSRPDIYKLTPYQQTLVIDADYVVNSNQLARLFECDMDFLCPTRAYDVGDVESQYFSQNFGKFEMPMAWATVMYFRQSQCAETIFYIMSMIRNHWDHYRNLYQISNKLYRNDYALSIALSIVNGHTIDYPAIAWPMATVMPDQNLCMIHRDKFRITYKKNQTKYQIEIIDQDFHAMNKYDLEKIIEHTA